MRYNFGFCSRDRGKGGWTERAESAVEGGHGRELMMDSKDGRYVG